MINTIKMLPQKYGTILSRNSALFVNGPKASETYVHVLPEVDFQSVFTRKEQIQKELTQRQSNFNLKKLEDLYGVYSDLRKQKKNYDDKKALLSKELNQIIQSKQDNPEVNKLKLQIDIVKANIKKLKLPLWSIEETVVLEYLKLPNMLHPLTPESDIKIVHTHLTPPRTFKDHLEIGRSRDLLDFRTNENYYLKNEAALFELGAKFHFSNELKRHGFIQFSNPDFVKSLIVEGCGQDHTNSKATIILHHNENTSSHSDNRLHLTGGGSLNAFMAYLTKTQINSKYLPLQYFSMGRQYLPSPHESDNLFHVLQSSVIQLFQVGKDQHQLDLLLNSNIKVIKELYSGLGCHYRLVLYPARELGIWESARLGIQMFSTSMQKYTEVGNISVTGDYISKRLQFTFFDKKMLVHPFIMSGAILNVPKLLACWLEQEQDFVIPKQFNCENWSTKC